MVALWGNMARCEHCKPIEKDSKENCANYRHWTGWRCEDEAKLLREDVITQICRDVAEYLSDTLKDWQVEVDVGGVFEEQAAIEAQRAYHKAKDIIRM